MKIICCIFLIFMVTQTTRIHLETLWKVKKQEDKMWLMMDATFIIHYKIYLRFWKFPGNGFFKGRFERMQGVGKEESRVMGWGLLWVSCRGRTMAWVLILNLVWFRYGGIRGANFGRSALKLVQICPSRALFRSVYSLYCTTQMRIIKYIRLLKT